MGKEVGFPNLSSRESILPPHKNKRREYHPVVAKGRERKKKERSHIDQVGLDLMKGRSHLSIIPFHDKGVHPGPWIVKSVLNGVDPL